MNTLARLMLLTVVCLVLAWFSSPSVWASSADWRCSSSCCCSTWPGRCSRPAWAAAGPDCSCLAGGLSMVTTTTRRRDRPAALPTAAEVPAKTEGWPEHGLERASGRPGVQHLGGRPRAAQGGGSRPRPRHHLGDRDRGGRRARPRVCCAARRPAGSRAGCSSLGDWAYRPSPGRWRARSAAGAWRSSRSPLTLFVFIFVCNSSRFRAGRQVRVLRSPTPTSTCRWPWRFS